MTRSRPTIDGFLLSLQPGVPARVRGWPRPVEVGESAVWFHGYLADPSSLRTDLKLDHAASFATIVEAGWRRWRADVTERILGEFAAVLVTGPVAVVLGDRMGLRPLYWSPHADGIAVSTDLGVLVRETAAWRRLDEEYLADLFGAGQHLGGRTPYRDVMRLQAGEFAVWEAGRLRVRGGWRPRESPVAGSFDEHQDLLRTTVRRVVSQAKPPDGTAAVELSGGLDSSTLLAVLCGLAPVHALSFVYPGNPQSDETPWIRAALTATPASWHPIDASQHGYFTAGPELGIFVPAPSRRILNWALRAAEDAAAAAVGATAVLTGEGGDAVFLAGLLPWYLADLLRTGRLKRLVRESNSWTAHTGVRRPSTFWIRRAGIDGWRWWRSGQSLTIDPPKPIGVLAPWLERAYVADNALGSRARTTTGIRAQSVHGQAVLENILRSADSVRSIRLSASGGPEFRHPFLAPPLVDLALITPWRVGVDPRIDRAVQRYAFRGMVGETTLRRRSKPNVDEAIFRGFERNPIWREYLLDSPEIVKRGYADAREWTTAVGRATVGQTGGVPQFHTAIQIEVWLRHLRHVGAPDLLAATTVDTVDTVVR